MTRGPARLLLAALAVTALPAARPDALPATAERAYRALAARPGGPEAMAVVTALEGGWRLAGNPAYNAAIDDLRARLTTAGFGGQGPGSAGLRVEEFPLQSPGWDHRVGTLGVDEPGEPPVLSREQDLVSLAINSFPTGAGLRAALVDVGAGRPADYAGRDVRGAVVLTDAPLRRAFGEAVTRRGARGVVSTSIAPYVRAGGAAMSAAQQDVLQWDAIPYDPAARGFGFKASFRAAERLRRRLARGSVAVRVAIEASFYDGPDRTLVAEIPGRSRPGERIVLVAHVQEPGANDNASGCGTLYAIARGLRAAIDSGALPPPERTLTFLWVDEMRGSTEWLRAHPAEARGVQYMFALDMTGEDVAKTGGAFLIEKQADPSAVWDRPSDPHTEWGGGPSGIPAERLTGSLLNDLYLGICRRRSRDTGWVVRTNPYEGGSDHAVFAGAGVPSVLAWHFTDRYYHTNQDRPDKTSAAEMQHVAVATGTAAWLLASADTRDAGEVARSLEEAALARLALERRQGARAVRQSADPAAAARTEALVQAAWRRWYREALDSVLRLPAAGPDDSLRARVEEARARLR